MGLDDFFEQDHKRHKHGHDNDYVHSDKHYSKKHYSSHNYNEQNDIRQQILNKINDNPNFKRIVIVTIIGVFLILLLLLILLFPLIMKLIGFITENGIQGILESIWKGRKQVESINIYNLIHLFI